MHDKSILRSWYLLIKLELSLSRLIQWLMPIAYFRCSYVIRRWFVSKQRCILIGNWGLFALKTFWLAAHFWFIVNLHIKQYQGNKILPFEMQQQCSCFHYKITSTTYSFLTYSFKWFYLNFLHSIVINWSLWEKRISWSHQHES